VAEPGRYRELDGLRGIAAITVVLTHWVLAFEPSLLIADAGNAPFRWGARLADTKLTILWSTDIGVATFFVLSGFVLAASLTTRPASLVALGVRRWVRLAIPILGTSLAICAFGETRPFVNHEVFQLTGHDWLRDHYGFLDWLPHRWHLVVHESLIEAFLAGPAVYNFALWTMPIEFWGSMGLFAAYFAASRFERALRLENSAPLRLATALLIWAVIHRSFLCGLSRRRGAVRAHQVSACGHAPHPNSRVGGRCDRIVGGRGVRGRDRRQHGRVHGGPHPSGRCVRPEHVCRRTPVRSGAAGRCIARVPAVAKPAPHAVRAMVGTALLFSVPAAHPPDLLDRMLGRDQRASDRLSPGGSARRRSVRGGFDHRIRAERALARCAVGSRLAHRRPLDG